MVYKCHIVTWKDGVIVYIKSKDNIYIGEISFVTNISKLQLMNEIKNIRTYSNEVAIFIKKCIGLSQQFNIAAITIRLNSSDFKIML